ncbi:putative ATP-grasp target RiPP [Streptacidiphilus sp. MAP12-20]|uniref:putative ATP-grasp-modified RiPP n=1 Tax=Streptacidiphilus sp. MAP12-20 TaxID=3156299 RepID=UPI003514240C
MNQFLDAVVPFAARRAIAPVLFDLEPEQPVYDTELQLNVLADGRPWHTTPQAASCTDTNQDGQGDDVQDPYYCKAS